MLAFRRITLFCLEKHLSKHNITIFSENLGGPWPLWPSLATPMLWFTMSCTMSVIGIATHFLGIFTVCKFAFVIYFFLLI